MRSFIPWSSPTISSSLWLRSTWIPVVVGLPEVRHHGHLVLCNRPWLPLGVEGRWQCRLLAVRVSTLSTATSVSTLVHVAQTVPRREVFGTLTGIVSGAAGHNRGRVVETPLFARTQGGTIGGARRGASDCRVSFKPSCPTVVRGWRATTARKGSWCRRGIFKP